MISDLGTDKLIIQAQDGDDPRLQATAQLWHFTREAFGAVLIIALAWPLAAVFGVPHARWAFYWLALVPLLRGLLHLDIKRLQRHMRFGPQVLSELGSQVLATILAWPLAYWLRDYSAMLWIVIAQTGVFALCTHMCAARPYRWCGDRAMVARLFVFGWPLLINSLLMFGVFQGDRAIVGALYSMRDLGLYAAAMALEWHQRRCWLDHHSVTFRFFRACRPIASSLNIATVSAPCIAASRGLSHRPRNCGPASDMLCESFSVAGAASRCSRRSVRRLLRVGTTVAAMSLGDTVNSMWSNAWRVTGIGGVIVVAVCGLPLHWIAAAALFGEVLALLYSLLRLSQQHKIRSDTCLWPALAAAPTAAAAFAVPAFSTVGGVYGSGLVAVGLIVCCVMLVLVASTGLRREIGRLWPRRMAPARITE
jgi:O-antigen/teichoic acid export membrane protein